jgi:serine/threonine-protein kinase RIM15
MSRPDTPSVTLSDVEGAELWKEEGSVGMDDEREPNDPKSDLIHASAKNPSILLELDMDGNVKHLSKSWEAIIGTNPQKILNQPISKIIYGLEDDKKVFTDAISIMMTDDTSYRVRFLTATNDIVQENSDEEADEDEDRDVEIADLGESMNAAMSTESRHADQPDTCSLSSLSTNGGIIELEGQGILIHSQGLPTHSMWILKPFSSNAMSIQLPTKLAETLGFGVDIFTSYLETLSEAGVINEEDVLPPPQVLCRICEQQVPSWWLEKHSELCLNEHKCESDVQIIHDSLIEQGKVINSITESLNNESYNISDGVKEYRGLPLPKVTPQHAVSNTTSPLKRGRSGSFFGTLRFPFKTLALLSDLVDYARNINPSEFQEELNTFEFSPNTRNALNHVSSTKIPDSSDPAINLLSTDTESLVDSKVEAVLRLKNSLLYSQKIKAEVDELSLLTIRETVRNIRNQTSDTPQSSANEGTNMAKGNSSGSAGLKYPIPTTAQSSLFTDSYLQNDILPNNSTNAEGMSIDGSDRYTPSRSVTPGESVPKDQRMDHDHHQHEIFKHFHDINLKSPVLTPQRKHSPGVPPGFHNSPRSSIQRNTRNHSGLESLSGTPSSSPLILAKDDSLDKKPGNFGLGGNENFLSVISHSSNSKPPLSPLLAAIPAPKSTAPSIKDYEILKPISKGAFGSVYLARRKVTGDYFAIKMLKKSDMIAKNQVTNVKAERAIMMAQSESPYVARLYSSFQSNNNLYLVMEYLPGGDCATLIKMLGNLPDEWAQRYIAQVIAGVEDLHKKGIVHHDLKPDNLLIDSSGHLKLTDFGLSRMGLVHRQERSKKNNSVTGEEVFAQANPQHQRRDSIGALTLAASPADHSSAASSPSSNYFESSWREHHGSISHKLFKSEPHGSMPGSPMLKPLHKSSSQTSFTMPEDDGLTSSTLSGRNLVLFDPENSSRNKKFVGTPDYLSPETIAGTGESEASDWWSVGCIFFEFLFGYPPFHDSTPEKIFQNILAGEIEWPNLPPEEELKFCSPQAKDLIKKLLVMNGDERLGRNGAEEIKEHEYFKGLDWDSLWLADGSFVPVVDDPESTDYFDGRGAEMGDFLIDDESESDHENEEKNNSSFKSPPLSNKNQSGATTVMGSPSASNSPTQKHLSLAIPLHMRERRPSKMNDNMGEFGSFQFRNLPALDKANKDVINRIKAEHLEHRNSISSSSSESGYTRSRNYSTSSPSSALPRPLSPSASIRRSRSASRGSFGSGNFVALTPTSANYDEYNAFYENSGKSSPSTDSGSPSTRNFAKQANLVHSPQTPSQPQPQPHHVRRHGSKGSKSSLLHRTLSEFSTGSSDTDESKSTALERVRKRRQSSKMSEGSQSQSDRPPVLDVLLCEPIPIVRYQLRKDLEAIGCAVVAVAAGDELIRRATGEVKFDVIMTALKIPKLDALDIVKLLKHTSSINSDTPIIAITAYYNEAISSAMFSEVLEKPVNRRNLQLALRKFSRWNSISNEEAVSDSEMLSDAAVSDADSSFTGNTVRMRSDG